MAARKIDPREQFSKKLAGRTEWFWFVYMAVLVAAIVAQPESSDAAVYLGIMATGVMIVNVWAYTKNSTYEKALYTASQVEKLRLTWKQGKGGNAGAEDDPEEDENEDDFSDPPEDEGDHG